ncbi:hypothetical protein IW140_004596 [Coemansia sp. RSA 1813]|nr:hypothetical protein EV178_002171 [Coemansia sp. RSA 1646]KAJ1766043.1 hypothetical protein LPJ74_006081 [Coemansia sp. RSA 1843]KAJ2090329.1 hypothetical protein IW138_002755 [Coemansia sp. RSA 986]KAJ2215519.1 hypothetical protein EV179_002112 [Coemansia sp. RSA 487]KAJ2567171.1 hypothetical protein IW140_004596 [Coemansia sp. RSA 1813]
MRSVIVYGGRGALGAAVVSLFRKHSWGVINVDFSDNSDAHGNVMVETDAAQSLSEQGSQITQSVSKILGDSKADAVICVAGGWQGGNAASESFLASADASIKQSVHTSLIAAYIAARHLRPSGLLALTGAVPALDGGTPGMVGYGMAKAAVHHLVASLSMPGSGVDGGCVVGILPVTLDTPANRAAMPAADHSSWTPLQDVADMLYQWASGQTSYEGGKLYKVITNNGTTCFE